MPTLSDSHLPKPSGPHEFEKIVCSSAKNRWRNSDFTLCGRNGQSQDGVDVYGQDLDGENIGIQCKNSRGGISKNMIIAEIKKAEKFTPSLNRYYIATTADTDSKVQKEVRSISEERKNKGQFGVYLLFWTDIWHDLNLDDRRLYQHYPSLKPSIVSSAYKETYDEKLFEKFKTDFPYEPTIRLLKHHDFAGSFLREDLRPLNNFVRDWDQAENEFLDGSLQRMLKEFYDDAVYMREKIGAKTFVSGNTEYASTYSDYSQEQGERSEAVLRNAEELNEEATKFVNKYENFVRFCKNKLENG